MARLSGFCCLLLMCSWYQVCKGNPFIIGGILTENMQLISDAYEKFDSWIGIKPNETTDLDLLEKMEKFSCNTEIMKYDEWFTIGPTLQRFYKEASQVQSMYEEFLEYVRNGDKYGIEILHMFATSSEDSLGRGVDLPIMQSIFKKLFIKLNTFHFTCKKNQSKQQLMNDLLERMINSRIKRLLISMYSYDVMAKYEKVSVTYERRKKEAMEKYTKIIYETFEKVKEKLKAADRTIWKCDPSEHIQDVTYSKLEEVFQGFFTSDGDLVDYDDKSLLWLSYTRKCPQIPKARSRCETLECKAQHYRKRCNGIVRDCSDIILQPGQKRATNIQICHADPDSDRRYEWVRGDQAKEKADYGVYNRSLCYSTQGMVEESLFWTNDICICNCESQNKKLNRYFSLQDVLSDENKVVTGAKLTLDNHVFHIQIQQGILGANGTIIDKPEWKNIKAISKEQLLSKNVGEHVYIQGADKNYFDDLQWKKNNLVYTVTYNQSYVYLDTLDCDPNRLVTGLRFKQVGDHLKLEIQTTPFDYATGELDRAASSWESNDMGISQRKEVILQNPGSPAEVYGHDALTRVNKYIHFRTSDLAKDVGSWTVPFIDFQEVVTTPPMPLGGAGLIHKGKKGSGGFLALDVRHYDFTRHL